MTFGREEREWDELTEPRSTSSSSERVFSGDETLQPSQRRSFVACWVDVREEVAERERVGE